VEEKPTAHLPQAHHCYLHAVLQLIGCAVRESVIR
jgi:hypothetical protein